jgi:TPR repeat protein
VTSFADFQRGAAAGDHNAMNALGERAQNASPPDIAAAQEWFRRAAGLGNTTAMYNLGWLHQHTITPPDLASARRWYEQAAAGGNSWAMNEIGGLFHGAGDLASARLWYEKAAAHGSSAGNYNLGVLHQYKFDPPDHHAALKWYEKAAAGGYEKAYFALGYLLRDRDPEASVMWYEKAVAAGEILAMNNLGNMLERRNLAAATEWYERGAAAGDAVAKQNLVRLRGTAGAGDAPPAVERTVVRAHVRGSVPPATPDRGASTGVSELLDALGDDDPYRHNAFRLAALDVAVERRGLARRVTELDAAARLGAPLPSRGILPVTPAPDLADVKAALNQLREPVQRLVQEWFWFWPGERPDQALECLTSGDADGAARAWLEQMNGEDGDAGIAAHNIAVLRHVQALETSRGAAAETWLDALTAWDAALVDDGVWQRISGRAARIDERRLCPSAVDELRSELPRALLGLHAARIVRAAEDGDAAALAVHVAVLDRLAGEVGRPAGAFTTELVDGARSSAARTLAARVSAIVEEEHSHAAQRPSEAAVAANRMLDRARLPLQAIDRMRPATDPVRSGAHDDLVHAALQCNIRYYNATNDAAPGTPLMERITPVATTERSRSQLAEQWVAVVTADIIALADGATEATRTNPRAGADQAQWLLDQADPLMARIRQRGELGDERLAQVRDLVARCAASCAVATFNETSALSPTSELLDRARSLAAGQDVRGYIDEQVATLAKIRSAQALATTCWFCKARPGTPARRHMVPMYGNVVQKYNSKQFNTTTVEVPRCEECWTAQRPAAKQQATAGCLGGLGFIAAFFGFIVGMITSGARTGVSPVMFTIGGIGLTIAVISMIVIAASDKSADVAAMQYPPVADLVRQGWRKGTRPV